MHKYRPETSVEKKNRLKEAAAKHVKGEKTKLPEKPHSIEFGLKNVTKLIEKKKASLVVIAHDVKPLEVASYLIIFNRFSW